MVTSIFSGKFKMPKSPMFTVSLMVFCSIVFLDFHVTSVASHPTHGNLKVLQYQKVDADPSVNTLKQDEAVADGESNGKPLCVSCETIGGKGTEQVGQSDTIAGETVEGNAGPSANSSIRNRRWGGCGFKGIGC